jgi:hypothetical protein
MDKTPDAMFRRINPDYYYPTYGDDSTTEEAAPTLGKFYVKLQNRADYGLWGNFRIGYTDNSLAHVDRTLYGANLHYEPLASTRFGEKRLVLDGFAAQPGTVAGRDEFRGTGGSLYYLKHQDILTGSERVRVEIRDKASGLVAAVKNLVPVQDYTIDHLQGRVLLSSPLSPVVSDNLLVVSEMSPGDEAYLVVRYEYSTSFEELDNVSTGGRVQYWLTDHVRLGATANKNTDPGAENTLVAGDVTWRHSATTWLKLELGATTGAGATAYGSNDGGFNFTPTAATNATPVTPVVDDGRHGASRIDGSVDLKDVHEAVNGQVTFYHQSVEGGYAAPGYGAHRCEPAGRVVEDLDHRQGGPAGQGGQEVAGAVARDFGPRGQCRLPAQRALEAQLRRAQGQPGRSLAGGARHPGTGRSRRRRGACRLRLAG